MKNEEFWINHSIRVYVLYATLDDSAVAEFLLCRTFQKESPTRIYFYNSKFHDKTLTPEDT